jgi:hypothetical protein
VRAAQGRRAANSCCRREREASPPTSSTTRTSLPTLARLPWTRSAASSRASLTAVFQLMRAASSSAPAWSQKWVADSARLRAETSSAAWLRSCSAHAAAAFLANFGQLGVACETGMDGITHAARRYAAEFLRPGSGRCILKVDVRSTFNTCSRSDFASTGAEEAANRILAGSDGDPSFWPKAKAYSTLLRSAPPSACQGTTRARHGWR